MILLAYIISGHPEWKNGVIKIFALFPENQIENRRERLIQLIKEGRLPISQSNITFIPYSQEQTHRSVIIQNSIDADLTIIGFNPKQIEQGENSFVDYGDMANVLFVNTFNKKAIE